jgi:hypothetical protein
MVRLTELLGASQVPTFILGNEKENGKQGYQLKNVPEKKGSVHAYVCV